MANITDSIYPVGSIYMSVSATNPSNLFGGTWVAWGAGRVPVGVNSSDADFNTAEKSGGTKTNTHNHFTGTGYDASSVYFTPTKELPNSRIATITQGASIVPTAYPQSIVVRQDSTFNQSISVVQPYITCYMWKRTA